MTIVITWRGVLEALLVWVPAVLFWAAMATYIWAGWVRRGHGRM